MKKFLLILLMIVSLPLLAESYKYNLSVCMIFRDEAPYLKEWIEFHRILGVEHFYLYNNLSVDNYKEVLQPYIDTHVVELMEWSLESTNVGEWDTIQIAAYNDGLKRARKKTKWLALIDSDEFLFPVKENNLSQFLKPYENQKELGGILVSWVCYGTSWVAKIPEDKLLIETLTLCSPTGSDHFKTIFLTKRTSSIPSPHFVVYKPGYKHRSAGGKEPPFIEVDKIRINHYWSRDEWYLNNFKIPKREKWGTPGAACVHWAETSNIAEDHTINRFIPKLRKRVFNQ